MTTLDDLDLRRGNTLVKRIESGAEMRANDLAALAEMFPRVWALLTDYLTPKKQSP